MDIPIEILAWADESIDAWIEMKRQSPESITTAELITSFLDALDAKPHWHTVEREVIMTALACNAMQRLVDHV